jgi:hypothetical protein
MAVVLVMGDAVTTTAVAIATTRPGPAAVVEADACGGSLAGWWGIPSGATTAQVLGSDIGLRLLPSHPAEAQHMLSLSDVSAAGDGLWVVDAGCPLHRPEDHVWVPEADVAVVVVRQGAGGPRLAATRVERRAHLVRRLASVVPSIAVAVVGHRPFRPEDVGTHLLAEVGGTGTVITVPEDPRAATLIAGRTPGGVRRWHRTGLARAFGSWAVPS